MPSFSDREILRQDNSSASRYCSCVHFMRHLSILGTPLPISSVERIANTDRAIANRAETTATVRTFSVVKFVVIGTFALIAVLTHETPLHNRFKIKCFTAFRAPCILFVVRKGRESKHSRYLHDGLCRPMTTKKHPLCSVFVVSCGSV